MAINDEKQKMATWAKKHEMGPPALWEKETLQSLGLFAVVSFALIAYVLLVVKKQKSKKNKQA